ncbi:histidinol-phosphate transaminase [Amylibacter sp.]|nr:histidinol-phosphate transaminase [Amylibacter sp.]
MTKIITPKPGIMDIELYVGGKSHAVGIENTVKLSSNENPFGPSPKAKDAYRNQTDFLAVYPSSDHNELRQAIANINRLNFEQVICGNGSDEIITFLCQAFAGVGDEVLFTEHGFGMYRICALGAGATPVEVPENSRVTDVDGLIERCTENTKLIFIANPNNPTGTFIPLTEIERLIDGVPKNILIILDGAYAEYVEGYDGGAQLVEMHENVVMTRTFSKVYGLGGLRIGWGYASPEVVDILARLRGPFNINRAALSAAIAAVNDENYVNECLIQNKNCGNFLINEIRNLGFECDDTYANFILPRFIDENQADAANAALENAGLIVRQVKGYNLHNCLRITIGKEVDCYRVINTLKKFKENQS